MHRSAEIISAVPAWTGQTSHLSSVCVYLRWNISHSSGIFPLQILCSEIRGWCFILRCKTLRYPQIRTVPAALCPPALLPLCVQAAELPSIGPLKRSGWGHRDPQILCLCANHIAFLNPPPPQHPPTHLSPHTTPHYRWFSCIRSADLTPAPVLVLRLFCYSVIQQLQLIYY